MDGFRLLAAAEVDGELHELVETNRAVVGCAECGTRAVSKGLFVLERARAAVTLARTTGVFHPQRKRTRRR